MDLVPKPEPGSPPPVFATTSPGNLRDMSVSELIAVLRPSFRTEDYDKVEEVLESKYAMLKAEVRPLRERFEFERLGRIRAEEELRKRVEDCERGRMVLENYEILLKSVKEAGGLAGNKDSIEEMKKKIGELECENFELKEMKKKWVGDVGVLRKRNVELVCENYELKELKNKWVDDSKALDELRIRVSVLEEEKFSVHNDLVALRRKNSALEEERKKDLATLEELRAENRRLADEKRGVRRKFGELNGRLVKMEDDMKLLMSADTGGGNIGDDSPADLRANFEVNDEEAIGDFEFGNDSGRTMKRSEDTHPSLGGVTAQSSGKGCKDAVGAPGEETVKLGNDVEIINLDDSDDDDDRKKRLSGIRV